MATNGVKTSKSIASKSSKYLKSEKSSKQMKEISGSALSNAKKNTKKE